MAISPIAKGTSKVIASLPKTKPIQKLGNWFNKDFDNALALTTIASICLKDGVGCAMYVYQSKHNEKIPEKRRKFVSALDLTNGILMIASQIGMFFAIRKFNEKIFDFIFRKSFNGNMFKHLKELIRVEQKAAGKVPDSTFKIKRDYNNIRTDKGLSVFKTVTELFAATIVGKRVIVPFIATPLAKVVEKKWDEKNAKAENKQNDKSNPTMQGKTEPAEEKISTPSSDPASVTGQEVSTATSSTNLLAKYRK